MALDEATIRALFPRAADAHVDAFARLHDPLFTRFRILPGRRVEFFLAQIGHESGGLAITEENLNYRADRLCAVWPSRFATPAAAEACAGHPEILANTVYCNRMGNGGPDSGDGWTYRGRGYIQVTGRDGYREVGRIAGLDLAEHPELAAMPEDALLVACAFWEWKGLNPLCDGGDFDLVTRRINGGLNGIGDRRAWLDKVRRALAAASVPPAHQQPDALEVVAIQRALRRHGYREVGAADGIIGPRTTSAITRFRAEQGLPPGLVDEALRAALGQPVCERDPLVA